MAVTTIFPDVVCDYITTEGVWSDIRIDTGASVDTVNVEPTEPQHSIEQPASKFIFKRTYMEFDLSSITDTIVDIELRVFGETASGNSSFVVYGGSNALTKTSVDFPLYLTNLLGSELGQIEILYRANATCTLDIVTYPPTPKYIVGLVSAEDFLDTINTPSPRVTINNTTQLPRLQVSTISAGYANTVNGVPGANITSVSGVSVANITNIMGV